MLMRLLIALFVTNYSNIRIIRIICPNTDSYQIFISILWINTIYILALEWGQSKDMMLLGISFIVFKLAICCWKIELDKRIKHWKWTRILIITGYAGMSVSNCVSVTVCNPIILTNGWNHIIQRIFLLPINTGTVSPALHAPTQLLQ